MEKHEQNIIKLISENDLSVICSGKKVNNFIDLPLLFKKYNAKIYCLQITTNMVKSMYSFMSSHKDIDNKHVGYDIGTECYITDETKIIYSTYEIVINLLMKQQFKFCNIILLDEIHHYSVYYETLLYLWLHFYDIVELPKLILSLTSSYIPYLPVDISDSTYVINDDYHIIYEEYNNNHSLFCKIQQLNNKYKLNSQDLSVWIVYLENDKKINVMKNQLKQLENIDYTVWNNKLIYNQKGRRLLVLSKETINFNISNVDGVIDSMSEVCKNASMVGGNDYIKKKISKSNSINRAFLKKGFVYRHCTKQEYDSLDIIIQSELERLDLTDIFINMIKHNCDPYKIFKPRLNKIIIDRYMDKLIKYDIPNDSVYNYDLPLSINNVIFISQLLKQEKYIYEGIIFACIMNIKHKMLDIPNGKFDNKDTIEIYYISYCEYLQNPENSYSKTFLHFINTVNKTLEIVTKYYDFPITIKSDVSQNVIIEHMKEIAKYVYSDNICIKQTNNYYYNKKTKNVYELSKHNHPTNKESSNTIIALQSIVKIDKKTKKKIKKINYYINL